MRDQFRHIQPDYWTDCCRVPDHVDNDEGNCSINQCYIVRISVNQEQYGDDEQAYWETDIAEHCDRFTTESGDNGGREKAGDELDDIGY